MSSQACVYLCDVSMCIFACLGYCVDVEVWVSEGSVVSVREVVCQVMVCIGDSECAGRVVLKVQVVGSEVWLVMKYDFQKLYIDKKCTNLILTIQYLVMLNLDHFIV